MGTKEKGGGGGRRGGESIQPWKRMCAKCKGLRHHSVLSNCKYVSIVGWRTRIRQLDPEVPGCCVNVQDPEGPAPNGSMIALAVGWGIDGQGAVWRQGTPQEAIALTLASEREPQTWTAVGAEPGEVEAYCLGSALI